MNILGICSSGEVLSALRIVRIAVQALRIAVPIILIISLILTYVSAMSSNDDNALTKANKSVVPKVIAIILVFLMPTFVNLVGKIAGHENIWQECISNANKDGINAAYRDAAITYIARAKETINNADYLTAKSAVAKLSDNKSDLEQQLNTIKGYVDIKNNIYKVAQRYDESEHQKVLSQINGISDPDVKQKLQTLANDIIIKPEVIANSTNDPGGSNSNSVGWSPVSNYTMVDVDVSSISCPIWYAHDFIRKTITINPDIKDNLFSILPGVCSYIASSPYIDFLQDAGWGVHRDGGENDYHAKGLAVDLNTLWNYTSPKTGNNYRPYASQGTGDWNTYVAFICDVCNGQENCEQNVNYQIYHRYFEGKGWCWGGNWGPSSFDPMHFEYRQTCYTSNKERITCN